MAVAQQFFGRTAIARIDRGSDAGLEAVRPRSDHERRPERQRDAFGELRNRFGHGGGGNRDGEFVTGSGAPRFRHRGLGLQPFGHSTQHAIAAGVPEHVVDLLESVEADNQQRHFTGFASPRCKIITDRPS